VAIHMSLGHRNWRAQAFKRETAGAPSANGCVPAKGALQVNEMGKGVWWAEGGVERAGIAIDNCFQGVYDAVS
jgi:hypothetical protein